MYTNTFYGTYGASIWTNYDRITKETRLTVEEHVVRRRIYDVVYHVDDARIYDVTDVTVVKWTYENHGTSSETYTLKVEFSHERSRLWNSTTTVKFGVKTEMSAGVPFIADGKIKTSTKISEEIQWGESESETLKLEDTYHITVNTGKRRQASCVGRRGKCDIPFTYVQRDLLYNGEWVTKNLSDSIYNGANYYELHPWTRRSSVNCDSMESIKLCDIVINKVCF